MDRPSEDGDGNSAGGRHRRARKGLDARITLIPRGHRLLSLGLILVLGAAVIWGFLGSVPTKVHGLGIIVRGGHESFVATSEAGGTIAEILVAAGDRVDKGQAVARLALPDLEERIRLSDKAVAESRRHFDNAQRRYEADLEARQRASRSRVEALQGAIETTERQRDRHQEVARHDRELRDQGVLSEVAAMKSLETYEATLNRLDDLGAQLALERAQLENFRAAAAEQLETERGKLLADERELELLQGQRTQQVVAVAPQAGRVEEIRVGIGDNVERGDPIVTLSLGTEGHEALAFLDSAEGAGVEPGQAAHVVPDTVKKAEYGSIRGRVLRVSEAPVSSHAINTLIRNPQLADAFAAAGPPFLSRIELSSDPATSSGFAWWTGDGPPFPVSTGTRVEVDIVVREERPVALVIPAFRELLGL